MGGTLVEEKASFRELRDLPREAVDCIVDGWLLSIKFSRKIHLKLLLTIKNKLVYRILSLFVEKAIDTMEAWVEALRRDPEVVEREFSNVNIRSVARLVATAIRARAWLSY